MPYTVKTEGMDEINAMLGQLEEGMNGIAAQAVYEGAGTIADELKKNANAIVTEPFNYAPPGRFRLPSPEEKAAILGAGGIARFDNQGGAEVRTSVGYNNSGYAMVAGHIRPIPLLVNSINSGTSFMKKQPFVRKTASIGGKKAVAKMKEKIESEWAKVFREVYGKSSGYGGK